MFLVCVVIPVIRNSAAGHACSASLSFQRIKKNLGWNGPLEIICSSFLLRAGELLIKIRLLRAMSRWVEKISKDRPCHPWRNCPHWEGYFFFISHWNIPCATCVHCLSVLAAAGSLLLPQEMLEESISVDFVLEAEIHIHSPHQVPYFLFSPFWKRCFWT